MNFQSARNVIIAEFCSGQDVMSGGNDLGMVTADQPKDVDDAPEGVAAGGCTGGEQNPADEQGKEGEGDEGGAFPRLRKCHHMFRDSEISHVGGDPNV